MDCGVLRNLPVVANQRNTEADYRETMSVDGGLNILFVRSVDGIIIIMIIIILIIRRRGPG